MDKIKARYVSVLLVIVNLQCPALAWSSRYTSLTQATLPLLNIHTVQCGPSTRQQGQL